MASDINEQFFNEKQLYTGDVLEEDADVGPLLEICNKAAGDGQEAASSQASQRAKARERRRKKRAIQIVYWLETKYDVLYQACSAFENWKEAPSANYDFDLLWCDTAIPAERFMKLRPYQKMNHFVGMSSITRKNNLGRNLLRMRKQFPKEYRFFPDTWILPTDLSDFKMQFSAGKGKTFIIKPDNGCQGKGIFLIRDVEKVPVDFSTTYVAQRYINKPFLLDGYKFDLRLYVLVLGCDPLRIFLHRRGLVRLASEQYEEPSKRNIDSGTMHLTNYAINKMNPDFQENTDPEDAESGHKRSLEAVFQSLRSQGYDVDALEREIEDLVVKTLIAVQPSLSHFYRSCQPDDTENGMCFEVLGFDVMLDHKLQPWLLEVNHAPSFATESELDQLVKEEVLKDTFHLLHLSPEARRQKKREVKQKKEHRAMGTMKKQSAEDRLLTEQEVAVMRTQWEDHNLNNYKRLYPSEDKEREYMHIHDAAVSIWEMLMGGTSRRPVGLLQRQDAEGRDGKGAGDESGKGTGKANGEHHKGRHAEDGSTAEKRTVEEMKEIVDRLSAGLGAASRRARKEETAARHSQEEAAPTESRQDARDDESACGNEAAACSSTPTPHQHDPSAGAGDAMTPEAALKVQQALGQISVQRFEVKVGDVIKVETTLGWEKVVVKAKRNNGKIDIQFKDGEYMRAVLPRIMRESATPQRGPEKSAGLETQPSGTESSLSTSAPPPPASQAATSSLGGATSASSKSPLKSTGSSNASASGGGGSSASKCPPLPPCRAAMEPGAADLGMEESQVVVPAVRTTAKASTSESLIAAGSNSFPLMAASGGVGVQSSASEPQSVGSSDPDPPTADPRGADTGGQSAPVGSVGRRARSEAPKASGDRHSAQLPGPLSIGRCPRGPSPVTSVAPPPTSLQELHQVHEARLRQQLTQLISVRQVVTQRP
eukprot:CAMPEP_0178415868 /NCGR_PEP_ID=MMETSP0689_2-20121128/23771_1 /TAXON_ID=160604 /ORGANISM="Amphidinium massartii, Strain CS-259" /LENGTH=937 /DNA_ID=CAMNT_0020037197 /DNA_START=38 /DNA_END=2847 /DNA_ORIENTATION=+